MPKKENEKIKYKTQKAKKVKYPEAKIQIRKKLKSKNNIKNRN